MSKHLRIEFKNIAADQSDVLVALLNEIGFTGFEEEETGLNAYIPETDFDESVFRDSLQPFQLSYTKTIIEERNWNALWEASFEPVVVDDFAAVRAAFHAPINNVQFEIMITPKMSFGTGHHATTYMMIREMRSLDFKDKSVFDFGTGTGVLAILAEKSGAKKILAIDNDTWSIENASENIKANNCRNIHLQLSDQAAMTEWFDIILANINKNVLLENLEALKSQLCAGGIILISGLLPADEQQILAECNKIGLKYDAKTERHNWLLIRLSNL